jgi:hypothetical protein
MKRGMLRVPLLAALLAGVLCCVVAQGQSTGSQGSKQPKSAPKSPGTSMTGCIDEQDGRYVLVNDRNLTTIANLEADGFPTEGFAKHVGKKVIVRGISNPGGTVPLFKVRTIETVNETCAPQQ